MIMLDKKWMRREEYRNVVRDGGVTKCRCNPQTDQNLVTKYEVSQVEDDVQANTPHREISVFSSLNVHKLPSDDNAITDDVSVLEFTWDFFDSLLRGIRTLASPLSCTETFLS